MWLEQKLFALILLQPTPETDTDKQTSLINITDRETFLPPYEGLLTVGQMA